MITAGDRMSETTPHRDQIQARAKIVEVLHHGGYRAELANGHICVARPSAKQLAPAYSCGDEVLLSFHVADLSRARIVNTSSSST